MQDEGGEASVVAAALRGALRGQDPEAAAWRRKITEALNAVGGSGGGARGAEGDGSAAAPLGER
jgi:hypothetical protein